MFIDSYLPLCPSCVPLGACGSVSTSYMKGPVISGYCSHFWSSVALITSSKALGSNLITFWDTGHCHFSIWISKSPSHNSLCLGPCPLETQETSPDLSLDNIYGRRKVPEYSLLYLTGVSSQSINSRWWATEYTGPVRLLIAEPRPHKLHLPSWVQMGPPKKSALSWLSFLSSKWGLKLWNPVPFVRENSSESESHPSYATL